MEVTFEDNAVRGRSVVLGPLVYSYSIPASCTEDNAIYDNLAGKKSANPDFKSWTLLPDGKWNYALSDCNASDVEIVWTKAKGFPFDQGNSPVVLRVKASELEGWELKENRFTPAIPDSFNIVEGSETVLELVPYGSTTLRLTTFPVACKQESLGQEF